MLEAIILAGGFGTRLRQAVPDLPKSLAPINGRPFIDILIAQLLNSGVSRIVMALGYLAETVEKHLTAQFSGVDFVFSVENTPLGSGGAIALAMKHCKMDHVYVFNGDTFVDVDIRALDQHWKTVRAPIMVATTVQDTSRFGRLVVADGLVQGMTEKGTAGSGLINAGCYVFGTDEPLAREAGKAFSLEHDYLPQVLKNSRLHAFVHNGLFIDIGVPQDWERAQVIFG